MALFADLLHSKTFTFFISHDETPVVVHSGAISKLSSPLDRLINGSMKEAEECCARFPDLEVEDFDRICEFAYRGDYACPSCMDLADPKEENGAAQTSGRTTPDNTEAVNAATRSGRRRRRSLSPLIPITRGTRSRLTEHFKGRKYKSSSELSKDMFAAQFKPKSNTSASQDFGPIFLSYARLYAFAVLYMVEPLKNLTLYKLHHTLASFTLFETCRPAITNLARFAYENDYIPNRGTPPSGQIDELRELIVEYTGMHTRDLMSFEDHRRFLNEEGEYAGDLMDVLQKWRL